MQHIKDDLLLYETNDEELKQLLVKAAIHIKKLEDQVINDSWINNPDRSGGQFTDEELHRHDNW